MSFISVFDVLGPNMIGPSSSHTAGAAAIALLARKMLNGELVKADFTLYGSFARTYRGHGTDRALLGGIMGFSTDDRRIPDSFAIADEIGLSYSFTTNEKETEVHPNTVDIRMEDNIGHVLTVRGESIGGGKVRITRIDQVEVDFSGEYSTLIVVQQDKPGVVAHITRCLSEKNVNIAYMKLYREEKGSTAYSIVESDDKLPSEAVEQIRENKYVTDVMLIQLQEG
ncbi:MAG TPA: L-serine ammonia-lyase, iron-sulfur-dependent subunit beta [Candidatus Mediterraneibacter vanvlietii]|nr:L-serine ammonia-lyase, iron-sulfur-dependent subunit beta [Candidatus Mediterraneibacter vanvlietii]